VCSDPTSSEMMMTYLVIIDDGSSEIRRMERIEAINLRNNDSSIVRIRKMNHETVDKCNCCREYYAIHDESPDCRLCRDMWAVQSIGGRRLERPESGAIRSTETW